MLPCSEKPASLRTKSCVIGLTKIDNAGKYFGTWLTKIDNAGENNNVFVDIYQELHLSYNPLD